MWLAEYYLATKLRRILGMGPERVRVEYTGEVWHIDGAYGGPFVGWVRLASGTKLRATLRDAYRFTQDGGG